MIQDPHVTVDEVVTTGRSLVVQEQFDAEAVLGLLDSLSAGYLNVQARDIVKHAQRSATAARGGSVSLTIIARFALAHVMTLLEDECRD